MISNKDMRLIYRNDKGVVLFRSEEDWNGWMVSDNTEIVVIGGKTYRINDHDPVIYDYDDMEVEVTLKEIVRPSRSLQRMIEMRNK
jgi:hypothetical protein